MADTPVMTPHPDDSFLEEVRAEMEPQMGTGSTGNLAANEVPDESPHVYISSPDEAANGTSNDGSSAAGGNASNASSSPSTVAPLQLAVASPAPRHVTLTTADTVGIGFDQIDGTKMTCIKCKYPVAEPFRAKKLGKQGDKSFKWICRVCNNVMTMVYKHLNVDSLEEAGMQLDFISGTDAESFFRQAHEACSDGKDLRWQTVREWVISLFITRKTTKDSVLVSEAQLPLSVWKQQGFDIEAIRRGGRRFPHPDFGEVWTTPLKTISTEQLSISYFS